MVIGAKSHNSAILLNLSMGIQYPYPGRLTGVSPESFTLIRRQPQSTLLLQP